jgi:DNA-binding HxlR family transcriptional regulator
MITPNPAPTTGFTRLSCAVETTLNIIDGRWKVLILRELFAGTMRFAQLRRALQGVTQKMLTQQLRELEADGIVHRQVYPEVPPRVEYSLTPLGESLWSVLEAMHNWGLHYQTSQGIVDHPAHGEPALPRLPIDYDAQNFDAQDLGNHNLDAQDSID